MKGNHGKKTAMLVTSMLVAVMSMGQNLQQSIQLTKNEQFEKADRAFKSLINAKPDNGDNYFYEGENFFAWGKMDSAEAAYTKGIKMNATAPLNYAGLGKVRLYQGQDASDNFYKAKTLSKSKDATVLAKIAEAYTGATPPNRDLKQALDLLSQAVQLDSKNADIYIDLGDAQWASDPTNASNAIASYEKALKLDSKNVIAILREGMIYQSAANWDLSFQYYQKASQLDSTFAPAYRQKAEMLAASGRADDAVAQYKKYLALNDALSARSRYGKFLFLAKKYDDAITEIQKVIAKDSSDPVLYRILAYSQFEKKDYKNGLVSITKFFAKAANSNTKMLASDYTYYGRILNKNGQDSLAIVKMSQGATMLISQGASNDASDIYYQMGTIDYLDNNCSGAMMYFNKRIQTNPNDVNTYYYLGKAAYDCKNYQAADSAFSSVIAKRSDLLIGYQWKAYAEEAIDSNCETGLAIPICNQYIQKIGADTIKNKDGLIASFSYLGRCSIAKKDMEGAKVWFKRIQGLDPANAQAKLFFDSLRQPVKKPEGKK
ncbi:MAG TPA: tetratricopeptide repeat protein [Bacteroidia bacterium]|nr:tetratricopeptide repeat protein [Bacteroidia bacterium]